MAEDPPGTRPVISLLAFEEIELPQMRIDRPATGRVQPQLVQPGPARPAEQIRLRRVDQSLMEHRMGG